MLDLSNEQWNIIFHRCSLINSCRIVCEILSDKILHWQLTSETEKLLCQKYIAVHTELKKLEELMLCFPTDTEDISYFIEEHYSDIISFDENFIDHYYFDNKAYYENEIICTAINMIQLYMTIRSNNISEDKMTNNYFSIAVPGDISACTAEHLITVNPIDKRSLAECEYLTIKDCCNMDSKYIDDKITSVYAQLMKTMDADYDYYSKHAVNEKIPNVFV